MSSFINTPEHFNSIERKLHFMAMTNNFYVPYSLKTISPKFYDRQHYNTDDVLQEISEFMDTMRELNVICVTLQYRDHYQGILDKEIKEQTEIIKTKNTSTAELTEIGLYKAIQCMTYQIETKHLKELRQLTVQEENAIIFFEEIKHALAVDIISELPEYNNAKWSID